MPFKDNLKKFRKHANLTQADLAEKMNVSQGTIGNWESGYREPDLQALEALASILGVSTDALIGVAIEVRQKETPIDDERSQEEVIDLIVEQVSAFPKDQKRHLIDKLYFDLLNGSES